MSIRVKKCLAQGTSVTLLMLLVACGGGGGSGSTESPAPPPTGGTPTPPPPGGSVGGTTAPSISTQPANATVLTGATATFSVVASGGSLSYQWRKNGTPIAGATSAQYTTPPADYRDAGAQYSVVVSNASGSTTSTSAVLSLKLSDNQQAFENLILSPATGSFLLNWNLNFSGGQVSGTNFAISDSSVLAASPLTNGPQTGQQGTPQNLASTLALPTLTPRRYLKNGTILVVPATTQKLTVSYTGSDIRVDGLAADGTTVAYSEVRSDYAFVPLSGALSATPGEMAHWYNSFFANPGVLDAFASYAAGAGYLKFTEKSIGDRYYAFDCGAATTDANITPCLSNTSLATALSNGIVSSSDGLTYHTSDGVTSTVGGVPVWVANAVRPTSTNLANTPQYRIYFQLGSNVYTGVLVKDGTLINGSYYVSSPGEVDLAKRLTFLPYHIRLNKAARDSIKSAMKI